MGLIEKKLRTLEDMLLKMQRDLTLADLPGIKKEMMAISTQFNMLVKKEDFAKVQEDVRKNKNQFEDFKFDFKQHQENYNNFHRDTTTSQAEMQSNLEDLRTRFESLDVLVSNLRKNYSEM